MRMRTFWLSLLVIAGALLLVGLRVEGSKKVVGKKDNKEREVAAERDREPTKLIDGYGETEGAARANALREAQEYLERELRAQMKPEWSFPRRLGDESGPLDPDNLEKLGILSEAQAPVADKDVGGFRARYKVTLTQKYSESVLKKAREEYVSQEKVKRKFDAGQRQFLLLRLLGGAVAVLLVVAGYLHLEEATRGYYTTLLRVAAVGLLVLAMLGLVIIG